MKRRCLCGEDISSRPGNHTQCLACYRHSQNNSESESEESVSEDEEYERECRSCGVDISNRPLNFTQCLDCWRSGRGIPRASLQGLSTFARRVNDSSTLNRDENEIFKRRRSHEQSLKETKEELELLKQKAEVDKLKEEDIERQLRMAKKKRELKELKNENREKCEEENKEEDVDLFSSCQRGSL